MVTTYGRNGFAVDAATEGTICLLKDLVYPVLTEAQWDKRYKVQLCLDSGVFKLETTKLFRIEV